MSFRVIENAEQPLLDAGAGSRSRVLAAASGGTTCMSVVERWFDPGAGVAPHRHPAGVEEVIWIRRGEARVTVGTDVEVLGADCTVIVPPLVRHEIENAGTEELYVLSRWSAPVPSTVAEDGTEGEPEVPGTTA